MIKYSPTGAKYNKDFLFNLRPQEWKQELLRRITTQPVANAEIPVSKDEYSDLPAFMTEDNTKSLLENLNTLSFEESVQKLSDILDACFID